MNTKNSFGKEIKSIRNHKNLTIRQVGEKAGISHSYISQIENGRRDTPNPEIINKIAIGLGIDYLYLMQIAGYLRAPEKSKDFLLDVIHSAPPEFKEKFMVKHNKNMSKLIEGRNKILKQQDPNSEYLHPEVTALFTETFKNKSNASDYLYLLRTYRGIDIEKMASLLNLEAKSYIDLEENIEFNCSLMATYEIDIGKALGVENFKDWLLFAFTETNNENFINSFDQKEEMVDITLTVPTIVKRKDSEGNTYFKHYSEDELIKNFNELEHILSDDRKITYKGKYLSNDEKMKILLMVKIIFDDIEDIERR